MNQITWNGEVYSSLQECPDALGISREALISRRRKGYTCDADMFRGIPCQWNGKRFKSIAEAARKNFVTKVTMRWRLERGYTCDADMQW